MGDMDGAMALPALLPMEGWKPMAATPAREQKHLAVDGIQPGMNIYIYNMIRLLLIIMIVVQLVVLLLLLLLL